MLNRLTGSPAVPGRSIFRKSNARGPNACAAHKIRLKGSDWHIMANVLVKDAGNCPTDAYVGPYWFVRDASGRVLLMAHRCALSNAEEYGDFLTRPHGHYEVWEGWRTGQQPESTVAAIVRDCEYEDWPRGRVVFHAVRSRFIVYADSQIFRQELQERILERFRIPPERALFSRDEHYVSKCKLLDRGVQHDC